MIKYLIDFFNFWKENLYTNTLPFCEVSYSFNSYIPQLASALAHFPYVPITLYSIGKTAPSVIPNINGKDINNHITIQLLLQLVTMVGHIVPNPRSFLIQEFSIFLTLYWIYSFIKITTTTEQQPPKSVMIGGISLITASMWIIGLQTTINLGIVIVGSFLASGYKIMNKLTKKSFRVVLSLFFSSFAVLALEDMYCDYLISTVPDFPWHLIFDVLFWQVVGSASCVIVLSQADGKWIKKM